MVWGNRGCFSKSMARVLTVTFLLQELASKLPAELEARRLHVRQVGRRLQVDKDAFLTEVTDHKRTSEIFLQSCLFPRCRLSPEDAIYCSRYAHGNKNHQRH